MENIVDYFSNISSVQRSLILALGIAIFWIIEGFFPLVKFEYRKWHHAKINIFFTVTTILVNFTMAFILLMTAQWTIDATFGILNWLPEIPLVVSTLIGLMLLDLIGAYLAHLVQHRIKWMWRFHIIHHTDIYVDTTSANRHHPGESVIRFTFTILAVIIVGAPMWMVFLYQSLSVVFSQFNHANITLPKKVDKLLSWFIISPDMHKVHHHYMLPYTDTNYGNIFSIWDRIFGTFSILDRSKIIYGVDTHMNVNEHSKLKNLLMIPFQKGRKPTNINF